MPAIHQRLLSAFALSALSLATGAVFAAEPEAEEESISIVGTRVPVRSDLDTSVPVDLISGDDLSAAGITDVGAALEKLAPSFNIAEMSIADGSDHVKPAMLRGLGPDQTLVLVNGKRRHQSALIHIYSIGRGTAGTDLNAIPMSAVKRIEILRDGASAQYGSDAIAGVINIVLKNGTSTELSQGYSITDAGDGETFTTAINTGIAIDEGVFNVTFEHKQAEETNRADKDPAGTQWRFGDPKLWQTSAFYNFNMPIGDSIEFYSFGGVSVRDGEAAGYYRCNDAQTNYTYPDADGDGNAEFVSGCYTTIPAELEGVPRFANGFLPLINSRVKDTSAAAGLRFDLAGWNADLSYASGKNSFAFDISNSVNFSYGLGASGDADAIPTSAHAGDLIFNQDTLNFDISQTFGMFQLAFGAEARHEQYRIKSGEEYSWNNYCQDTTADEIDNCDNGWAIPGVKSGIQVFPGWTPEQAVDLDRDSRAAYAEASSDLSDSFRIEGALRYEDYDDFGSDLSAKLSARFKATDSFSLRGSFSDGFRAPSLQQIGYSQVSSNFVNGVAVYQGIYRIDSDVAAAFEIPKLEAEDSKSVTLGTVITPMRNFQITLDAYRIEIKDRISISGSFARGLDPVIDSRLPDGVDAVAFFTNAIDTETTGVDLTVHFRQDVGDGKIDYTFASSYSKTEVTHIDHAPGVLGAAGRDDIYFDRHEQARLEKYAPRNRHTISAVHKTDAWKFGLSANYFGAVTTVYDPTTTDYDYTDEGRWVYDLVLGYDFNANLGLDFGIANLTDEMPEKQHGDWNGSPVPYSTETAQWGLNGRTYSLNLAWKF